MRKHLKIIVILCLISSLARFVLDSYLPSLPAIGKYFSISDITVQWTLTLYLLGFSFSQLVYGPLSDRYGRKAVILVGLCLFLAGNLGCALASSPFFLLLARCLAGVGAGACGVMNRAIASDCFTGTTFSKAWSYTTTTLVVTLCTAPILGGYIQEIWGWRANFGLSTMLVAAVIMLILKFLPETHPKKTREINNVAVKLKIDHILKNYASILKAPTFFTSALCYTLAFSGLILYFQISPLLLINGLGFTPSQYGWSALIIAGNYLLGGLIVNRCAERLGIQRLLLLGACLLIVGGLSLWIAISYYPKTSLAILLPSAIYVVGARIVIPNAIANAMEKQRHLNGSSSALLGFIQMLGSFLMSFAISSFDNTSALPLAVFLTTIGIVTLFLARLNGFKMLESRKEAAVETGIPIHANFNYRRRTENCELPQEGPYRERVHCGCRHGRTRGRSICCS